MTLPSYNGTSDPSIYLTKFRSVMVLNNATDSLLCRAFPTFLEGFALLWFSNLPQGSIENFEELSGVFTNHFSSYGIYTYSEDALNYIK